MANNRTWKDFDLFAKLSAYLDEIDNNTTLEDFINKFENSIDIEHITLLLTRKNVPILNMICKTALETLWYLNIILIGPLVNYLLMRKRTFREKTIFIKIAFCNCKKISESMDWGIEEIKKKRI